MMKSSLCKFFDVTNSMNTVALEYSMYVVHISIYICIQEVLISLKIGTKHETQCNYSIFTNIQLGNILFQVFE